MRSAVLVCLLWIGGAAIAAPVTVSVDSYSSATISQPYVDILCPPTDDGQPIRICGEEPFGPYTSSTSGVDTDSVTWSETFTLTGGTGLANIYLVGDVLAYGVRGDYGSVQGVVDVSATSSGSTLATIRASLDGAERSLTAVGPDPSTTSVPLDGFQVEYGKAFTITYEMQTSAFVEFVGGVTCVFHVRPASMFGCGANSIAAQTATFSLEQIYVPLDSSLSWASSADYDVVQTSLPEPQTWAMALLGVAGITAVRRRKLTPTGSSK